MTMFYARGEWRYDCLLMWLQMAGELCPNGEYVIPRASIFVNPVGICAGDSGMWVPEDLLRDFIPGPVAYAAFVNDDEEAFNVATGARTSFIRVGVFNGHLAVDTESQADQPQPHSPGATPTQER